MMIPARLTINTEGSLAISRDPPESGKHIRSGADSLAESDMSKDDWSVSGDDWASAKSQSQPKSEFGSYKPLQNSNPESKMMLCFLRSLSSLERRKNMVRVNVSSSRRILMS
jgi:hypothetical protein